MIPLLAILGVLVIGIALFRESGGASSGVALQIAHAIGVAEGGYDFNGNNLGNGTRPSLNHNPGDLTIDTTGKSTGVTGAFVVYGNDADGWDALTTQVNLWLSGGSANANADSTIDDISKFYTTTDQSAWASNVAAVLGVPSSTPIGQIGQPASPPAPNDIADNSGGDLTLASASTSTVEGDDDPGDDGGGDDQEAA